MSRFLLPVSIAFVVTSGSALAQDKAAASATSARVSLASPAPAPTKAPDAEPKTAVPKQGLTLQDTLMYVYNNSPRLQAAKAGLHAAHELYPQALAGRRSTLTTQGSIYTTDVESSNFGRGDGATTKEFSVNLEQPLYSSGRTDAQVDRANALIKASYATFLQGEQDLFYETARAYMNVVRNRQILHLTQKNEDIIQQELQAVVERFDGGDVTKTDVEQTKSRRARAQADRMRAQGNLEESYAEFQAVTGFAVSGALHYPVPNFPFPASLSEMVTLAEDKNQILRESRHQLQAAEDEADAILSELLPQINAVAAYQKEYDPQPGIIDEAQVETIGLRATLTLYQGGSIRSRVREARSRAQQRRYEIQDTQQDIKAQVLESWKTLKMTQEEMTARTEEINAAQRARDGVKEEAKMGERTILDTLDADQEVIGAETSYINVRYASVMASFALARALGIFSPEGVGMGQVAYDPGDHYRRAGDKLITMNPD